MKINLFLFGLQCIMPKIKGILRNFTLSYYLKKQRNSRIELDYIRYKDSTIE